MRRWLLGIAGGLAAMGSGGYGVAWFAATPDVGALSTGAALDRVHASPQWAGDGFTNPLPQVDGPLLEVMGRELDAGPNQVPDAPIPVVQRNGAELAGLPASGLQVTWFGHSSFLVDIDGVRVLVDPVWGDRASPWSSVGPERFYAPPLPLDQLPAVDAVIISHDHYDHLDLPTVLGLRDADLRWLVPLGVGAHLEHWGVPAERITELDWWQDVTIDQVTLTATPARHFSGRWLTRFSSTLWVGWAMRGPDHSVFYSGDTALHPTLEDIGTRLGPFDLTLMDAGAYDRTWTDVHLGPEQTVIAHQMVRGGTLLPVHWGLFDLGNHGWTEPMERVVQAAARQDVRVLTPRPGESVELGDETERWWPDLPHETVESDPVWSTSVDQVITRWWGAP